MITRPVERQRWRLWRWSRMRTCLVLLVVLVVTVLTVIGATPLIAHELRESAVTLVIRDGGALEVRLLCTWSRLLIPTSGASATPQAQRAALARLAAESPEQFATRYASVRRVLESELVARMPNGTSRPFQAWQWPTVSAVQEALREEFMADVTATPGDHHPSRLMATARLVAGANATGVRVQMPSILGPVLFTILRPKEQWLPAAQLSPLIPLQSR